jgi:type I restriction enzyme R subunit
MIIVQSEYLTLRKGKTQDKAVEAVLEYFLDEEKRKTFYTTFSELSDIYDILSPDPFLRPYIDDMEELVRMYRMVKENFDPALLIDREFSKKVAQLVQRHTGSSGIGAPTKIYEIDDKVLRRIEERPVSDIEKVFNLIKMISGHIQRDQDESPYLLSIGEKADAVIQLYKDRQKTTQDTLEELKKIITEIQQARKEQEKRNISIEEFSIFWLLQKNDLDDPESKARSMKELLKKYPHWRQSEQQAREVKGEMYKILLQSGSADIRATKKIVDQILTVLRRASP